MATPNIVPRADSEGAIGTASKYWASAYIDVVYVGAGSIGRDSHNLISFVDDNNIYFRIDNNRKMRLDAGGLFPHANDGIQLGYPTLAWSDLFLASGAVINFDNGNVTLTHSNNALTLADGDALHFGTDNDLRLFHTSGESLVQNTAGHFYIQNTADDKDIVFSCDDGSGGTTAYLTIDGGNTQVQFAKNTNYIDNINASFGSSGDLKISHSGTNSSIENETGHLYIINDANDGDIVLQNDDGSGGVTEYFRVDGSSEINIFSKNVRFNDSVELQIGAHQDLKIYHNGSTGNNNIDNTVGDLYINQQQDNSDIIFRSDNGAGNVATYFYLDGSSATHDGSATTNLYTNWPDNSRITVGTSHDLQIVHTGSNSFIHNLVSDLYIRQTANDKDIIFETDDGSGGIETYFYLDGSSATHDGSATTNLYTNWPDKSNISLGTSHDFTMKHDGTNTTLRNLTGNLQIQQASNDANITFTCDNGSGGETEYFRVDGEYEVNRFLKNARFNDNVKGNFGTGDDLQIYHDGTNSALLNTTGDLYIMNSDNDKDIIFQSDDGSGGVATYFSLDGSLASGGFVYTKWPDNSAIALGSSNDLVLWHDASNSYIRQVGTGDLIIENITDDKDIIFKSDNGSGGTAAYITLDGNAGHTIVHKEMQLEDNVILRFGTSNDTQISHSGSAFYFANGIGDVDFYNHQDDGDISFFTDDGSGGTTEYLRLDGGDVSTIVNTIKVLMPNLPTSDPSTAGQLWNDNGTLKISAG